MFTINQLKRKFDSVDNIMDRIDAGIMSLKSIEIPKKPPTPAQPSASDDNAVNEPVEDNSETVPLDSNSEMASNRYSLTVSSTKDSRNNWKNLSSTSAKSYKVEPGYNDDEYQCLSGSDGHSDLDSDTANALDAKYSEILQDKQKGLSDRRVQALKNQEATTDSESIRTEDFETVFKKTVQTAGSNVPPLHLTRQEAESTDTPLTEDFEENFKAKQKQLNQQSSIARNTVPPPKTLIPRHNSATKPESIRTLSPIRQKKPNQAAGKHSPLPAKRSTTPVKLNSQKISQPPKKGQSTNLPSAKHYLEADPAKDTEIIDTLDELSDLDQEMDGNSPIRYPSGAQNPTNGHHLYDAESESEDGDFSQHVREQTSRIQREIELERKLKSRQLARSMNQLQFNGTDNPGYSSLPRYKSSGNVNGQNNAADHAFQAYSASTPDVTSLFAAHQASNMIKSQLDEDRAMIRKMHEEKILLAQEIGRFQDELKRLEDEVATSELQAKENRARSEEARSQLMVAEFKKEAVLKEIGRLCAEVENGKRIIEEAEERQLQEKETLKNLGIRVHDVPAIIDERNEFKKQLESAERLLESEKDKSSKQLEHLKSDHLEQQQSMQEKVDTLRETVQRLNSHLERVSSERDSYKAEKDATNEKLDSLQKEMTVVDRAKSQALEQTIKGYDEIRKSMEKEAADAKSQLTNELNGIKKLLAIEEQKSTKLREEIQLRDELNQTLREQLHNVRQKASEEEESHDKLLRDLKKQLKDVEQEKLGIWDSVKQSFEVEKQKLLEATKDHLDRQHQEIMAAIQEESKKHISQLQHNLKGKEDEAYLLRERLSEQEQESRRALDRLRSDIRTQIEQAVASEKKIWEKEQKYIENEQQRLFKEKEESEKLSLTSKLDAEMQKRHLAEDQINLLKAELEESKLLHQKVNQEKSSITSRLKQAENSTADEVEKAKKELKQHYERLVTSLRDEIAEKDREIEKLKLENSSLVQSEADASLALEKFEKMMVNEINEECSKTSELLGVQPRKAAAVGYGRSSSPSKMRIHKRTVSRSLIASAIANLRACNEELRNSLSETKTDMAELKSVIEKSEQAKDAELEHLRNRLNNEKKQDLEELKASLAKMPACRQSLLDHKDLYQVKQERKVSEKMLRKSLSSSYSKLNGASDPSSNHIEDPKETCATQTMQGVQDRIKHLRAGSPFRYSTNPLAVSSPDISKLSSSNGNLDSLEQKVRLAELRARLAEERATRNQAMLSQKMQEVNQLQSTLNCQTKEIINLERSFDEFKAAQYSPTKYSLNSTFPC